MMIGPRRWGALGMKMPFNTDHPATEKVIDTVMYALGHPAETSDPITAILSGVCTELDVLVTLCRGLDEFNFLADHLDMLRRRVETSTILLRKLDVDPFGAADDDGPESAPEPDDVAPATQPTPRTTPPQRGKKK